MNEISIWDDEELDREEYEFLALDDIGTPTFFRVKNWEHVEELSFRNKEGNLFTRNYLFTTKGLLPLSAIRLRRQLKPFRDSKESRELVIQRWCEGSDSRSTVFKVELHEGVVTKTKKPPAQKRPKK